MIEEGQGSENLNAGVSGYDLFVFPQFYVALSLFVLVALSYRFTSCLISVSVGLLHYFARYLLSIPAMFKFCVYVSVSVHLPRFIEANLRINWAFA